MKKIFTYVVSVLIALQSFSQDPLEFLRTSYPKLTDLYQEELLRYPVHYIFAIDVSGTMKKYANDVQPAMKPFIDALPNGDMVSMIPFGTDAREPVGFSGKIDSEIRKNLKKNTEMLYNNPDNYDRMFLAHTNIESAVNTVLKSVEHYPEYKVNVIIFLTDFRNDVPNGNPDERKLSEGQLQAMKEYFDAATYNKFTRTVALDLATQQDKQQRGYCLPQLRDHVFPQTGSDGVPLEIVPLTNPGEAISQWFDQLKREIMVTKLKAIVSDENKMKPVDVKTETDIDGNVSAHIKWSPSKLYPRMKIDSTTVGDDRFSFINDTTCYGMTRDSVIDVQLGQIKANESGFHHLQDSLSLGIDLPTEYDDELHRLQIKKPLPSTTIPADKNIWTFPLSFKMCVALLSLLALYLTGVANAVGKNNALSFDGKVTVTDLQGVPVMKPKTMSHSGDFQIGSAGAVKIPDAKWMIDVKKVKVNPFLNPFTLLKKPTFECSGTNKFVNTNNKGTGDAYKLLDPAGDSLSFFCGETKKDLTHKVKIQYIK